MAPHSSILAWRIPGTEEPGGLPSMGLHRVGYDWSDLASGAAALWRTLTQCGSVQTTCYSVVFTATSMPHQHSPLARHVLLVDSQLKPCCCSLVTKLCPTLPMDCIPPGSSVHAISQSRILEWVAISFSRGSSQPRNWTHISCIGRQILYTEPPGKPQLKSPSIAN